MLLLKRGVHERFLALDCAGASMSIHRAEACLHGSKNEEMAQAMGGRKSGRTLTLFQRSMALFDGVSGVGGQSVGAGLASPTAQQWWQSSRLDHKAVAGDWVVGSLAGAGAVCS